MDTGVPTGLVTRRVLRHLSWRGVWTYLFGLLLSVAVGIAQLGPWGAFLGVFFLVLLVLSDNAKALGTRLTRRQQPELYALVDSVVARTGLRAPARIRLITLPRVLARARPWRRELLIGYPLVAYLSQPQLAGLVAHALSTLDHQLPWLVVPLHQRWYIDSVLVEDDPSLVTRVADLAIVGEPVQAAADAAAAATTGSATSYVEALVAETSVSDAFRGLLKDVKPPRKRVLIENLEEVWAGLPARPELAAIWDEGACRLWTRAHPSLAPTVRQVPEGLVTVTPAPDRLTLRPLTRRQGRRLARQAFEVPDGIVRWRRFERIPDRWWFDRAAADIESIEEDVIEVLGRKPVDAAEIAEVVVLRNDEVLEIAMGCRGRTRAL